MVYRQIIENIGLSDESILLRCCNLNDFLYGYHSYNIFVDETATKKVGAEIELTYVSLRSLLNEVKNGNINIKQYRSSYKNIIATYDGSIIDNDGVEFITPALNIDETIEKAEELLYNISAEGGNGAGLHIHYDIIDWFHDSTENICKFIVLCSMWQRCLFKVSGRYRQEWDKWCRQNIDYVSEAIETLEELEYDDETHEVLVNLQHSETIEYRGFCASTDPELIGSRIYFIAELINYSNKLSIKQVTEICKNRRYSNTMLRKFLNKFNESIYNTQILDDIKSFEKKTIIHKNTCMIGNKIEERYIQDIYRPVRSY